MFQTTVCRSISSCVNSAVATACHVFTSYLPPHHSYRWSARIKKGIYMSQKRSKNSLLVAFLLTLSVVFTFLALRDYSEYRAGTETYAAVSDSCTSEAPSEENVEEAETAPDINALKEFPKPLKAPITVDFKKLHEINEDVIGWIYIGAFPISYPVLYAENNDAYLRTTIEHKSNNAGSIFVDHACSPDFRDRNTVIYGHNMHDLSMFGKLKWFLEPENGTDYFGKDDSIWIITPDRTFKYKIFSIYITSPDGDAYTLFQRDTELFADWCRKMKEMTKVQTVPNRFTNRTRVITLSTCAATTDKRLVVLARLVKWSENKEE